MPISRCPPLSDRVSKVTEAETEAEDTLTLYCTGNLGLTHRPAEDKYGGRKLRQAAPESLATGW